MKLFVDTLLLVSNDRSMREVVFKVLIMWSGLTGRTEQRADVTSAALTPMLTPSRSTLTRRLRLAMYARKSLEVSLTFISPPFRIMHSLLNIVSNYLLTSHYARRKLNKLDITSLLISRVSCYTFFS